MKFVLLFICGLLATHVSFAGEKYAVSDLPLSVRLKESSVVRVNDTEVDLTETSAVMKQLTAVTLFNNSEYDYYSDIVVVYGQDENVSALDVRVYDKNGKEIDKIKSKDIEDIAAYSYNLYSDRRYKYVDVAEYEYPFTIEYSYTKKVRDTYLFLTRWELSELPSSYIEQASLTVNKPESIEFSLAYRLFGFELDEQEVTPNKIHFSVSNIPSFGAEDFGPSKRDQKPHIILSPHQFEIDGYEGSFEDWASLGAFYDLINEGRYELEEKDIAPIADKVNAAPTTIEKVDVVYKYLQEKARYVSVQLGIGGWQSYPASYVEENSFGDCKALTTYTKSLLSNFGIESYPVLIQSGRDNDLSFQLNEEIAYSAFNHVILAVPNEKDTIWLECTSQNMPTNFLGSFTMDRKGVMVKPNQESELVETPHSSIDKDFTKKKLNVKLKPSGSAEVELHVNASGLSAEHYFTAMKTMSEEDFRKELHELVDLPNSELIDYEFDVADNEMAISLKANFSVKNVMKKTGSRMFLSPFQFQPKRAIIEDVEDRKHPVIIPFTFSSEMEVDYTFPAGFQIENIDTDVVEIDATMGKYFSNIIVDENNLKVKTTYQRFNGAYPPESAVEFKEFTTKVNKAAKQMIVLKQGDPTRTN